MLFRQFSRESLAPALPEVCAHCGQVILRRPDCTCSPPGYPMVIHSLEPSVNPVAQPRFIEQVIDPKGHFCCNSGFPGRSSVGLARGRAHRSQVAAELFAQLKPSDRSHHSSSPRSSASRRLTAQVGGVVSPAATAAGAGAAVSQPRLVSRSPPRSSIMKRTYQASKVRRARTHGFLVRMKTRGGRGCGWRHDPANLRREATAG